MNHTAVLHQWSGGLLCSFGLYLAQKKVDVLSLINIQGIPDNKVTLERVPTYILRQLSDSLDLPLFTPTMQPESVQKDVQSLLSLVNQKYGVHSVVLNGFEQDGSMDALKKNYEDSSFQVQNFVEQNNPYDLFEEAMNLGFKAHIFAVNEKILGRNYLGAQLTSDMLKHFKDSKIHPFGANGEFETVCVDGPNFKHKVLVNFGDVHFKNGYWYREIII